MIEIDSEVINHNGDLAKYKLKEIKNLDIKEILNYYKEENKNKIAIPDIYFYIFYKNISKDKYSHNFINSYSNCKNFNK